jgi:lipoprotein-releasing system ATP-binding protein
LHIVGTLDRPDMGEIFFKGKDVLKFDETRLSRFRNEYIGFVFQFHHLLFEFTALENTMMPSLIKGDKKSSAREKAMTLLSRVGLENRLNHRIGELSGGEQQRVALARALVQNPLILLADEPTGNLDEKNSDMVHQLLLELNREYAMTMIVVTHNNELAQYMNRRITIADGKLVEQE